MTPSDYLIELFERGVMDEQRYNPCSRQLFAVLLDDDRELPDGSHDVQNCAYCYYSKVFRYSDTYTWRKYGIQIEDIAAVAGRMHP
jgi:hypothetical protein